MNRRIVSRKGVYGWFVPFTRTDIDTLREDYDILGSLRAFGAKYKLFQPAQVMMMFRRIGIKTKTVGCPKGTVRKDKTTTERSNEMLKLSESGLNIREIGDVYGCSRQHVSQVLKKTRLEYEKRKREG